MSIRLNEDKEIVKTIKEGLKRTGGYCPCRLERTDATKCICEEFKAQIADPNYEGYALFPNGSWISDGVVCQVDAGGKPTAIQWEEDRRGEICLWEDPQKGHPYVLGGDTAGDGSDSFTAHLMDNHSGMQAAELLLST